MDKYKLGDMETKFAELIWNSAPVPSGELVRLCENEFHWKKSTTYTILRRLGAEEKMVARSATQQVALAFLIPLALALIHSTVGMKAANDIIAEVGKVDTVHSTAVTTLMLLLVYGGYFFATSLACRRMACKRG